MLKFSLGVEIFKRGFLLANNKLFSIRMDGLHPVSAENFNNTVMPILVVGKEHCRESDKSYPISDKKDLSEVIKMDFTGLTYVEKPDIGEHQSKVKAWIADPAVCSMAESKLFYWIPEIWLFSHSDSSSLFQIERAGNAMWLCTHQGKSNASLTKGLFKDASYFLMSIGIDSSFKPISVKESDYCEFINKQASLIANIKLLALTPAQGYQNKLKTAYNWLSVGLGVVVAVTLFLLFHNAYLGMRIDGLDENIRQQNVREVITLQKTYEQQLEALQTLEKSLYNVDSSSAYWDVLATLMENGTTILRVNQKSDVFEVRGQAKLATDILQIVGSLPEVEHAEFITPVRESLGNERFTIAIKWREGVADE